MSISVKPGQTAPESGQAKPYGPRGGKLPGEVTLVKGKTVPPTTRPGVVYKITDPTKHR
jgi:hypothetical protein